MQLCDVCELSLFILSLEDRSGWFAKDYTEDSHFQTSFVFTIGDY